MKIKGFSDITNTSPQKSSRENLYVMVMYDYDSNEILAEPIKIVRKQPSAMISSIYTGY